MNTDQQQYQPPQQFPNQDQGMNMNQQPQDGPAHNNAPSEECRLFVGNLSWGTKHEDLKDAFKDFNASHAKVIHDRNTGRSKGFGFVSFGCQADAEKAKSLMNDKELHGRNLRVDKANAQRR